MHELNHEVQEIRPQYKYRSGIQGDVHTLATRTNLKVIAWKVDPWFGRCV